MTGWTVQFQCVLQLYRILLILQTVPKMRRPVAANTIKQRGIKERIAICLTAIVKAQTWRINCYLCTSIDAGAKQGYQVATGEALVPTQCKIDDARRERENETGRGTSRGVRVRDDQ